jgi:hypothetical protein
MKLSGHCCHIAGQIDGQPPDGRFERFRPLSDTLAAILTATFSAIPPRRKTIPIELIHCSPSLQATSFIF